MYLDFVNVIICLSHFVKLLMFIILLFREKLHFQFIYILDVINNNLVEQSSLLSFLFTYYYHYKNDVSLL